MYVDRAFREVELLVDHHLWVTAENELTETDKEVGQAECRHEQNDIRLIDQRPQDYTLYGKGEREHHRNGKPKRQKGGHAGVMQANQREGGEHHHDALREIEYPRCLENEYEAERDEGVKHAADHAFPQRLYKQVGCGAHLHERIEEDFVENVHASSVRDAEISVDYGLVSFDLIGRAVGDLDAVIKHHHSVG